VPHDISVVGFDDIPIARYVRPTLTTVAIPTYEIGSAAMRLLLAQLEGSAPPGPETLPTRLVVRDSAAPPAPE
jgi:DNA-binding LacI/PurR family transcriptional regulator